LPTASTPSSGTADTWKVRYVAAPATVDGGWEQERPGEDGRHVLIEVGIEQPCQLKPGLVDDVVALGGRCWREALHRSRPRLMGISEIGSGRNLVTVTEARSIPPVSMAGKG
jgi:hypothetical protein